MPDLRPDLTDTEIVSLRDLTPGTRHVRHFNHAGASLPSRGVLDTVVDYLRHEAEIGGYEAAVEAEGRIEAAYRAVGDLVGMPPDAVAFMENGTRGWDMVFYGIPYRPGDRIVTTMAEYSSNVIAAMQIARRGVEIVVAPNDASGQVDLDRLADLLTPGVRAVLVSHMPTNSGLIQPATEIGAMVRDRVPDAWYVLDAIQTVGQMPLDMTAIGCDALAGTSRKYLRGPRGVGFVAVRPDRLDELEPPMLDNHAAVLTAPDRFELRPDARRLESWEFSIALRLGMGAAAEEAQEIGLDRIWRRIDRNAAHLREVLAGLPGVTVRDVGRVQGGTVSFTHQRVSPPEIMAALAEQRINVTVSRVASTRWEMEARGLDAVVRASVHAITTDEEIDALAEVVEGIV